MQLLLPDDSHPQFRSMPQLAITAAGGHWPIARVRRLSAVSATAAERAAKSLLQLKTGTEK